MKGIAKFEKISFEQYQKDFDSCLKGKRTDISAEEAYEQIILPRRATKGSAGYDFFAPFDFLLKPKESIRIPTGIRVRIDEDFALLIYPRSGLGFKYRLQLDNTVGVIDSDYYFSENEGHIQIKLTNDTNEGKELYQERGKGFAQGIFSMYGLTVDDVADNLRNGGFGSTT